MKKLALFAALVFCLCTVGGYAKAPAKAKVAKPSIAIKSMPKDPPSESMASGLITGAAANYPKGAKVVIYALGDTWYVQPYTDNKEIYISKGKWSTPTHGGYKFAALLVSKDYSPSDTLSDLPKVDGKKVLAITIRTP